MTYYERLKRKRLSDILVDEGVASKEAVIAALQQHQESGYPLSHMLVANGELKEYDLARVLVEQYQLPYLELVHYSYHRDLIQRFPGRLLHHARMVPLDSFGEVTTFVCQEFPSEDVFEELATHGVHKLFLYAALASDIRAALNDHVQMGDEPLPPEPAAPLPAERAPAAAAPATEDTAWKELFDAANEAIVSESATHVEEATPLPPPIIDDDPVEEKPKRQEPTLADPGALPDFLSQE